jgi:drug/metabolite transporter (DMT)-like permease
VSLRAWSCFAAVSVLWGIPYLFIKLAVDDGVSPVVVAWARLVIGAAILAVIAWRMGVLGQMRGRLRWGLAWGLTEMAIPFPLIAFGEQHVSSSLTAILIASAPLMVALLAIRLDPAERARGRRLAGLVIGLAGVVALVGIDVAGQADELLGAGAILLGTLCYAVGPFTLRGPLAGADTFAVVTVAMVFASLALTPFALTDLPGTTPSGTAIASLVVLGVACSAAALVLFAILVAEVGGGRAMVITYVAPVVAVALGVTVLGEGLGAGAVAGLLLILAGSWLATDGRLPPGLGSALRASGRGRPAPPIAEAGEPSVDPAAG